MDWNGNSLMPAGTPFDWRQNHGNERISYIERAWECLLMRARIYLTDYRRKTRLLWGGEVGLWPFIK